MCNFASDDLTRAARQAAAASEEEHGGMLRLAQERCDDAVAESARLRRELSDLEETTARRATALMDEESTKSAVKIQVA